MGRKILILFAFLFSVPWAALSPGAHQAVIDSGITLTLDQEYDKAIALFKRHAAVEPKNPLFDFYLLLTYEGMMIDYETTAWEKNFDSLSRRSEAGFKALQKQEPDNAWVPYFLGSLYVTRGAHELRFSHYLNFTKSILNGITLLKTSVKMDSTLYDAYLYLGLFQFARSKFLSWLPVFDDERDAAIGMIEKAMNESTFSRQFASQVLTGLYGHTGEIDKAIALATEFKRKFPKNRAIYWILGNACLSQKRYPEAEKEFLALRPMIEAGVPAQYPYNNVSIDALLANIAYKTGRYEESLLLCGKIAAGKEKDPRLVEFRLMAEKLAVKCEKKIKTGKKEP
jgi:tetratricopeptide (TPR) repeat protein